MIHLSSRTNHPPTRDIQLVWLGALALLLLILASDRFPFLRPLRLLLGLAYVLYTPGYCLTAALFPHDDLDPIARVGLSLGLSIAIVPPLALLLDHLPWGIRLWPILLGEYTTMALCTILAAWRRARLPLDVAYTPALSPRPHLWWRSLPSLEKRLHKLLAAALLLAALSTAWRFLRPSPDDFMTEFYILGKGGLAEAYPHQAARGEPLTITIGVANKETTTRSYSVQIWATDPRAPARRERIADGGTLTLAPHEKRHWPIHWQMPWVGDNQKVEFLLFHDAGPEPYRRLHLWLDVVEPGK